MVPAAAWAVFDGAQRDLQDLLRHRLSWEGGGLGPTPFHNSPFGLIGGPTRKPPILYF